MHTERLEQRVVGARRGLIVVGVTMATVMAAVMMLMVLVVGTVVTLTMMMH